MVVQIPLTKGKTALIDDADAAWVCQHKWSYRESSDGSGYAMRVYRANGKCHAVYLHRAILNAPCGMEVDHKDLDKLNNQRSNLRLATRQQNAQNMPTQKSGTATGIRGVSLSRSKAYPYRAHVKVEGRQQSLGQFATIEEATAAAIAGRQRFMTHAAECDEVYA